jgi:toxin ParE1/3/4
MAAGLQGAKAVQLRLSGAARDDIEDLLAWSEEHFGTGARQRYEALLACALRDVADEPHRPGVRARPELGRTVFSYHLSASRLRVAATVLRPRHLLIGRHAAPGVVDILRVLHDAMEISWHLPDDAEGEPAAPSAGQTDG